LGVKKVLALFFAVLSGLSLLLLVLIPDPLPFLDEATALLVLVQSLSVLGLDVRRFLPFFGKRVPKATKEKEGPVVDV
jgi:hypothetical protein